MPPATLSERFPPPPMPGLWLAASDGGRARLAPDLHAAEAEAVVFALDPASVRISGERSQPWTTQYEVSAQLQLSAPGTAVQTVEVRYAVTLRNEDATPARMRQIHPFDPATIPDRARIEVFGRDYAGTALEAGFRVLAEANALTSIDELRLSLEMTADGELRVMTGANRLFDTPREGGPASPPSAREDFVRHTTLLDDPRGVDRPAYARMLLDGQLPEGTVRIAEDVAGTDIAGLVTDTGSGEENRVVWTLDAAGRPRSADAVLTWEPGSGGRDSDRIEAAAQSRFRVDNAMKGSGDDVGHMLAYRFVAGHGPVNMFPQESGFNQRVYARMEQEWSDWLAEGMEVHVAIALAPDGLARPDRVQVDYAVVDPATGVAVYDPRLIVFDNRAGQVFDHIARKDMDRIIEGAS